jgi:hypothetical protein
MERKVTQKNIQVKEDSGIPITDYAPPKGINNREIINRVLNLIEPNLENTIENLTEDKTDYFIQHLALDLQRSLKHWQTLS